MDRDANAQANAGAAETLRRAFLWAGLIIGQAILLRGITNVTTWLYVFLLTITAFVVDQPLARTRHPVMLRWGGVIQAVVVVATAIVLRIFIAL